MKILYIHGYGGSANGTTSNLIQNELSKCFPKLEICAPQMSNDLMNFTHDVKKIKQLNEQFCPDLVISSSYGAMCTLIAELPHVQQIMINPCLNPLAIMPKILDAITINDLSRLKKIGDMLSELSLENSNISYLISENDELFGDAQVDYSVNYLIKHRVSTSSICLIKSNSHHLTTGIIQEYLVPLINIKKKI